MPILNLLIKFPEFLFHYYSKFEQLCVNFWKSYFLLFSTNLHFYILTRLFASQISRRISERRDSFQNTLYNVRNSMALVLSSYNGTSQGTGNTTDSWYIFGNERYLLLKANLYYQYSLTRKEIVIIGVGGIELEFGDSF